MRVSPSRAVASTVLLLAVVVTSQSWAEGQIPQTIVQGNVTSHGPKKMLRTVEMEPYQNHFFTCGQRAGGAVDTDHKNAYYSIYELSGDELVNGNLGKSQIYNGKMYASPSYHEEEGFRLPVAGGLRRFEPNKTYYYLGSHRANVNCSNGITITETDEEAAKAGAEMYENGYDVTPGVPGGGGGATGVGFGGGGGATGTSPTPGANGSTGGGGSQGVWPRGSGPSGAGQWPSGTGPSGAGAWPDGIGPSGAGAWPRGVGPSGAGAAWPRGVGPSGG